MIAILVESASASSIEWVVRMIDASYFVATDDITSHMNRRASGSMPLDGSSRRITGGFPIIAIPTDNLRLFPPLSSPEQTFLNLSRSIYVIVLFTNFSYFVDGMPFIAQ